MVAETAEKMAQAYDVDPRVARMAGLLHDWDKALSPKRLRDRIATYGLDIDGPTQINMPQLLHGPTAAAVLADEFPEFGEEVFQAIERHTVGSIRMSALDMIVFCADKLEPGNDVQVYRDLYDKIGKMSLEDLFCAVEREGFMYSSAFIPTASTSMRSKFGISTALSVSATTNRSIDERKVLSTRMCPYRSEGS